MGLGEKILHRKKNKKMDMDVMEEENDHGNNINPIENKELETISDLFELCVRKNVDNESCLYCYVCLYEN